MYVLQTLAVGRVPSKISSSFSGFTAEQWKNWTLFFHFSHLKEHCQNSTISVGICLLMHAIFFVGAQFLKIRYVRAILFWRLSVNSVLQLYCADHCTINMHLHLHLADCVLDYGPVYAFWCFAYERMNGILGSYHTNNHYISVEFANRFLDCKSYAPINWPTEYRSEFYPFIKGSSHIARDHYPTSQDLVLRLS